jgi:Predicted soluble lytic transglycosylase fused to an ABC-type amino acid-binding protein
MPATAQSIGLSNPFDPTSSINAAAKYDAQNYKQFGNWTQALEAYNEGPTAVSSGTVYPQASTYASTILSNSGVSNTESGPSWRYAKNGDLDINFGGGGSPNGSQQADSTGATGYNTSSGTGTCPINDTPILSLFGYAIITPCGLWDLAVGLVGLVLVIAGLRSDVGKTVMSIAKSVPLE